MSKYAIITGCNSRYGNFLIRHWYRSLKENVDLSETDIIVFDYGLTENQLLRLQKLPVRVVRQSPAHQIVSRRFFDTARFLKSSRYDQILMADGGDIIFQSDISHLFRQDTDAFRVVAHPLHGIFHELFIPGNFTKETANSIYTAIRDKPVINAGFIIGPRNLFITLCKRLEKLLSRTDSYGPDQVAVNYLLYRTRTVFLPIQYNFIINNVDDKFIIKNGIFYTADGNVIPVVHNAGRSALIRPVLRFGYGPGYNFLNMPMYRFKHSYLKNFNVLKPVAEKLMDGYLAR